MTDDAELLDIAQAAALLQVSEASLRRWTNAGQLPCLRIGGRRERRFRRADLIAFLEQHPKQHPGAVNTSHVCGLYMSDLARTRRAAELLAAGLDGGSTCFFAAHTDVRTSVLARLAHRRPALQRDLETGSLVVLEYADDVAGQLELWETHWNAATRAGVRSLNVVGDVSGGRFAREGSFDQVLEYETEYVKLSQRFPVATTCLYDARLYSGLETARLLQVHPDVFRTPSPIF